jgi:hypothetical protein
MKRVTHSSTRPAAPKGGGTWRAPRRKAREALCRMRRRLRATRRVIEARELFVLTGRVETLQQLRIFRGRTPVDGWLPQMLAAMNRAADALIETATAAEAEHFGGPPSEPALCVLADYNVLKELSVELMALTKRLAGLAWFDAEYDLYSGVVIPAPVPESAKIRRRRAAASASPIPSRRPRRRLLKLAIVVRRVTRGRAPPPLFSNSL